MLGNPLICLDLFYSNPAFFKSNYLTPRSFSRAPFFMGIINSFGGKPGGQFFPCHFALDAFFIKQSRFRRRTTPDGQAQHPYSAFIGADMDAQFIVKPNSFGCLHALAIHFDLAARYRRRGL